MCCVVVLVVVVVVAALVVVVVCVCACVCACARTFLSVSGLSFTLYKQSVTISGHEHTWHSFFRKEFDLIFF